MDETRKDLALLHEIQKRIRDRQEDSSEEPPEEEKKETFIGGILKQTTLFAPEPPAKRPFTSFKSLITPSKLPPKIAPKSSRRSPAPKRLTPQQRQLFETLKKEFIIPIVKSSIAHGKELDEIKNNQASFESRAVVKRIHVWSEDWENHLQGALARTIYVEPDAGRLGLFNREGVLTQFDLVTGKEVESGMIGTHLPYARTQVLAALYDIHSKRVFILNDDWYLEAWDFMENSKIPVKRLKIHSFNVKVTVKDGLFPVLMKVTEDQKLLINSTDIDGFFYVFDCVCMVLLDKLRIPLSEMVTDRSVETALDVFASFLNECSSLELHEKMVFDLINTNIDRVLNIEEFKDSIKHLNLCISEYNVIGMFNYLDKNKNGRISLGEFWGEFSMRKEQISVKEKEILRKYMLPT